MMQVQSETFSFYEGVYLFTARQVSKKARSLPFLAVLAVRFFNYMTTIFH